MTRSKQDKVDLLYATLQNLIATRKMLKSMGKPMSTVSKMDDAINAIDHIIRGIETK